MNAEQLQQAIQVAVARLEGESKLCRAAVRSLRPFLRGGVLESPPRLRRALQGLAKLGDENLRKLELASVHAALEQWSQEAPQRLRAEFGRRLKDACAQRGIAFRVVRHEEPLEVRIPPFSLLLDFQRGRATWQFARERLRELDLDIAQVFKAYDALRSELDWKGFSPADFLSRCYRAYSEALFALGKQRGERVEFEHFLPRLALQLQQRNFLRNPRQKLFREYSRAHFAYDVWRLQRAGQLSYNGWRLNLGVATGDSARQPERVIYFEDGDGNGEYKLTVFFSRSEVASTEVSA